MEYKTAESSITQLARYVSYLSLLVIFLIVCNFSLGFLLWHQSGQENTILVPADLTKTAVVGSQGVDANYLLQCGLFFVDARLNLTPDTVDSENQLVLSHTAPQYYAAFQTGLAKEADLVKSQKISSTFYLSNIKANPIDLSVIVSGTLKRWVGERALSNAKKTYELRFRLNGSDLFLTTFQEIKKNKGN